MRNPTLTPSSIPIVTVLLAANLQANPIKSTHEDRSKPGSGPASFAYHPAMQPSGPHGFPGVDHFWSDFAAKLDPYRINVADYFHVEKKDWSGYGYKWLLETWSPDGGGSEEFCEVKFFSSKEGTLILQGAWTAMESEDLPLPAIAGKGGKILNGVIHIKALEELAGICEPDGNHNGIPNGGHHKDGHHKDGHHKDGHHKGGHHKGGHHNGGHHNGGHHNGEAPNGGYANGAPAVPEPATSALFATGILASLIGFARRRSRS